MPRPTIAPQQPAPKQFGPPTAQGQNISKAPSQSPVAKQNGGIRRQAQGTRPVSVQPKSNGRFKDASKPRENVASPALQTRSDNRSARVKPQLSAPATAQVSRVGQSVGRKPSSQNGSSIMPKPAEVKASPINTSAAESQSPQSCIGSAKTECRASPARQRTDCVPTGENAGADQAEACTGGFTSSGTSSSLHSACTPDAFISACFG